MKIQLKKWFTKKRIIWGIIILALLTAGYFLFFNKKTQQETLAVHPGDFLQQVSASGKIVAKENLDLSFEEPGQVAMVPVKVGDTVVAGQLLASQNSGQLSAQLLGMQAGIELEEAKLKQLLAGNSPEDIQIAKSSVIKAEQNINNEYIALKNALDSAQTALYDSYTLANSIHLTYFNGTGPEDIKVQYSKNIINDNLKNAKKYQDIATNSLARSDWDAAALQATSALQATYTHLAIIRQQCEEGAYWARVLVADKTLLDTQKTTVTTSLANISASQSNIASYTIELSQAKDNVKLKEAAPRVSDIAVFEAQLKQAKANAQNIAAQLNKKRIYSPINGIVTAVNAKVGRIFSSNEVAVSVISKNNFQIESYVPQINISLINIGQEAQVTLDAYGDTVFSAKVASVDPAETIKDGVSTYKVILEFTNANDSRIKSGMTGNIIVTTQKKANVISVPQGIVKTRDGQKFVPVKQGEATVEKTVQTGIVSSSGNIEITSGLSDGDVVILQ